jgi:hypothetical protein
MKPKLNKTDKKDFDSKKIVDRIDKEVQIGNRTVLVSLMTYDSGRQRASCVFDDNSAVYVRFRNRELIKENQRLKEELKKKK